MSIRGISLWAKSWNAWVWGSKLEDEPLARNKILFCQNPEKESKYHIPSIISKCKSMHHFQPNTTLPPSGHLQSVMTLWRDHPTVNYRREILLAPDGGEIVLDWTEQQEENRVHAEEIEERPVVAIFHGLAGSSSSSYVLHLVSHIQKQVPNAICVVMAARGCCPDRVLKSTIVQCASFTEDIRTLSKHLVQNFPKSVFFAVGFSLGANILCKFLGEEKEKTIFRSAIILANPFDLVISNQKFDNFVQRTAYSPFLVQGLKEIVQRNMDVLSTFPGVDLKYVLESNTVRDFDERFVIKFHNYPTVYDYYYDSSSARYAGDIKIPTLCVNAEDDPVAPIEAVPTHLTEQNENLVFCLTAFGGHLGWMESLSSTWSDRICVEWIQAFLSLSHDSSPSTLSESSPSTAPGSSLSSSPSESSPLIETK